MHFNVDKFIPEEINNVQPPQTETPTPTVPLFFRVENVENPGRTESLLK